jgi:hypothetical protein
MTSISPLKRFFLVVALAAASASCGSVVREGSSPVFLIVDILQGSRGGTSAGPLGVPLISDVITIVSKPTPPCPCPTVFNDTGQVVLSTALKNIGPAAAPAAPTTNNMVTITRYHVAYVRADGQNVQGVDVPYAFDAAVTGTIPVGGTLTLGFELVRSVAKQESPLVQLETSSTILTVIANVTFYGTDLVGNSINVTGSITVEFGNFGDPA